MKQPSKTTTKFLT